MDKGRDQRVFLTATGFAVRQAMAELEQRGISTAPLLREAGLPQRDVDQMIRGGNPVRHRISAAGQAQFLDLAAEALGDSAFGLHLAGKAISRDLGILFYVVSGGKNIEEALTLLARYQRIANEAIRLKLKRSECGLVIEADLFGLPVHCARQNAEFGFAVVVKILREVSGRNISPTRIKFAHPRNSDLKDFKRFFICPVEFGRASIEGSAEHVLEISSETLAIPLITADPKLVRALMPFCEAAAKERGMVIGTLRSAVEREIEKWLPHGKAQAQNVSKALALSVRTLSRRLADEGTTYSEVVDQLRRSLAQQYLKDQSISLSQIAWLLGYEGSTSFNHAFKRWTGRSPAAARNEKQLTAPQHVEPEPS
jgi:AraC-like DNA-binding protein